MSNCTEMLDVWEWKSARGRWPLKHHMTLWKKLPLMQLYCVCTSTDGYLKNSAGNAQDFSKAYRRKKMSNPTRCTTSTIWGAFMFEKILPIQFWRTNDRRSTITRHKTWKSVGYFTLETPHTCTASPQGLTLAWLELHLLVLDNLPYWHYYYTITDIMWLQASVGPTNPSNQPKL